MSELPTDPPREPASGSPLSADAASQPVSRRRRLLVALVVVLVVGLVAAVFALDAVVGSQIERPLGQGSAGTTGGDLADCADDFAGGFSERARAELVFWYGPDIGSSLAPTAVPDGFPASVFAWSGIVPACASTFPGIDGEPIYLFYAPEVSRTRFDGVAAMLTATGSIMTDDQVPREPQEIAADRLSGAEAGDLDELYREFVVPGVGRIWLTLKTDDVLTTSGFGELLIEFRPGE